MISCKAIAGMGMALVVTLQSLSLLFVQLEFSVSQPYIASVLCVNRDKPQMKCEGKCFLAKEVNRNADLESHQSKLMPGYNLVTLFFEQPAEPIVFEVERMLIIPFSKIYFDSEFFSESERPPAV